MIKAIESKKMCIRGSQGLKELIKDKDFRGDNEGANKELYYYFTNGLFGCSDNKPSRHKEISLTKFKKLI
jgi:hypothetical protein